MGSWALGVAVKTVGVGKSRHLFHCLIIMMLMILDSTRLLFTIGETPVHSGHHPSYCKRAANVSLLTHENRTPATPPRLNVHRQAPTLRIYLLSGLRAFSTMQNKNRCDSICQDTPFTKSNTSIGPPENVNGQHFLTISDTSLRKKAKQGSTSHANSSRTRRHSCFVNVNFVGVLFGEGSASTSSAPSPTPSTLGFGAFPAAASSAASFASCLRRRNTKHSAR